MRTKKTIETKTANTKKTNTRAKVAAASKGIDYEKMLKARSKVAAASKRIDSVNKATSISLVEANLLYDDTERYEWITIDELYEKGTTDETSEAFLVHKAFNFKSEYGGKTAFLIERKSGEKRMVSLPTDNRRQAIVDYFKQNTRPLGPVVFQMIDTGKGHPYQGMIDEE